jgi:hypothetical protein
LTKEKGHTVENDTHAVIPEATPEITEDMIQAGLAALYNHFLEVRDAEEAGERAAVQDVYIAMLRLAPPNGLTVGDNASVAA